MSAVDLLAVGTLASLAGSIPAYGWKADRIAAMLARTGISLAAATTFLHAANALGVLANG